MAREVQYHLNIPTLVAEHITGASDAREFLVDVLTNLRHFATAENINFDEVLDSSEMHWIAERNGDDD